LRLDQRRRLELARAIRAVFTVADGSCVHDRVVVGALDPASGRWIGSRFISERRREGGVRASGPPQCAVDGEDRLPRVMRFVREEPTISRGSGTSNRGVVLGWRGWDTGNTEVSQDGTPGGSREGSTPMNVVYTLMMYGLAAVMIFFLAMLIAGMIVGTILMFASLAHKVRDARRVTAVERRRLGSPI
jgi:hypothetical protein